MKKLLLILILLSSVLFATGSPLVIKSYNTDKNINIDNIAQYASKFVTEKQEDKDLEFEIILFNSEDNTTIKQNNTHKYRWIMIVLDVNLSSRNYWVEHTDFNFTEHTFNSSQVFDRFSLMGRKFISFHYDPSKDSSRYFLKAVNTQSHVVPMTALYTPQTFSKWAEAYSLKMLLSFFLFGLIFMAAIYNGALYLYNREKSFLYYMFMQFFMIGVLVYQTDIINIYVMGDIENEEIAIFFYFVLVEVVTVFILLFVRSFLETKKYLPKHDKILGYMMIFVLIDLALFFIPIMLILKLYSFLLLYVIWLAWLRYRQGYTPALFFMLGWFVLMLGIFVSDFFDEKYFIFDPILVGSTIESIFLAIAISYKMKTLKEEKEQQKELLIHQSKLASMGEMLGNIAHQWRQPLSRLGYILMNIESKDKEKYHTQKLQEASDQLEFISQTIDDFRDFFKPDKEKESFSLAEETQKVITLLELKGVEVKLNIIEDTAIINYKNEYKQVILNLLTNAKEVLLERVIFSPKIVITIDKTHIIVADNAGGIKAKDIQKIFEPYYSTKVQGSGIGLYMSKMIVEKNMGGKLSVKNNENGAQLILAL
jgi:signal transduction histidine kinase